ncbi:MAG: hypothetical protein R3F34_05020 [Planctomycetota bacterium]
MREPDLARPSGLRSAPREQRSATTAVLLARTAKSSLDARACAAEGLLALGVDVASLLDAEDPDRSAVLEAAIASCCAPEALPVLFTMLRDGASGVQGDVLEAAVRRCVAPYVWDASFAGARGRVRASIASEEAARVVAPEWRRVLLE